MIKKNSFRIISYLYSELTNAIVLKPSKEQSGDGELYGDAKYGKVTEKRKANPVDEKKETTPEVCYHM